MWKVKLPPFYRRSLILYSMDGPLLTGTTSAFLQLPRQKTASSKGRSYRSPHFWTRKPWLHMSTLRSYQFIWPYSGSLSGIFWAWLDTIVIRISPFRKPLELPSLGVRVIVSIFPFKPISRTIKDSLKIYMLLWSSVHWSVLQSCVYLPLWDPSSIKLHVLHLRTTCSVDIVTFATFYQSSSAGTSMIYFWLLVTIERLTDWWRN